MNKSGTLTEQQLEDLLKFHEIGLDASEGKEPWASMHKLAIRLVNKEIGELRNDQDA